MPTRTPEQQIAYRRSTGMPVSQTDIDAIYKSYRTPQTSTNQSTGMPVQNTFAGNPAVASSLGAAGVYQNPASLKHYRNDFGSEMTDAEYQLANRQREDETYQRDSQRRQTEAQRDAQLQIDNQRALQSLQQSAMPQNTATAPSYATGGNAVSQQANEQQQMLMLQNQLAQQQMQQEQAFARESAGSRMNAIERLGAAPQAAQVQHPSAGMQGGNEAGARAAAFARAKELAGQNALAALESVNSFSEGRGLMGSTVEGNLMGDVLGGAQGDVDDFIREQLISDLNRSANVADMQYQGGIQQRGQDMNKQQALLGLLAAGGLY